MIPKEMASQDGSSTESKITEKERICKLLPTSFKPNLERILKDCIKSKPTEVSDTDGVLELEVNTQRPQAVVEQQSESKERRNDCSQKILLAISNI